MCWIPQLKSLNNAGYVIVGGVDYVIEVSGNGDIDISLCTAAIIVAIEKVADVMLNLPLWRK